MANFVKNVLNQISSPLLGAEPIVHPWLNIFSPQNYYRARRVFNVPAHLSIGKVSEILLYLNPDQSGLSLTNSLVKFEMTDTVQSVYDKLMSDKKSAEQLQNILDLNFY